MLMDSTKFTNIVLSGGIIIFIIMGMISINLNYNAIQNQNDILENQNINMEIHSNERSNSTEFFKEKVLEILKEIEDNELLIKQAK